MSSFKERVKVSKQNSIRAAVTFVLLMGIWFLLPKDFCGAPYKLKLLLILDVLGCASLCLSVRLPDKMEHMFAVVLLLGVPAVCFFLTEYLVGNSIWEMKPLMAVLSYSIYLMIYLLIYTFAFRIRITIWVGMILCLVISLGNSFVTEFRGIGIRAADIYCARTAANVAGNYSLVFNYQKMMVILIVYGIMLLSLHCGYQNRRICRIPMTAFMIVYALIMRSVFWNDSFIRDNDIKPYTWDIEKSAAVHGKFLDFTAGIPYLKLKKPEGYSKNDAKAIMESNQNDKMEVAKDLQVEKPDIIVIMNESFADLSVNGDFETDVDPLVYTRSIMDSTVRGTLSVPVFGGVTANTEYEFLTGNVNAFFPPGIVCFQTYVKNNSNNLGKILNEQGYETIFMHPYKSSGWNRINAYRLFGFDEQYYIDDFTNTDVFRRWISDKSDYLDVIERYEEAKAKDEHVFIFNVTMQNHGGYAGLGDNVAVHLKDMEGNYPEAEEYLTCLQQSDEALETLISYFSKQEKPVLICFFGDHQPKLEDDFMKELQDRTTDSDLIKHARKYQTPFFFYANYDLPDIDMGNMSINYLTPTLLSLADLDMPSYMKYLVSLYEKYPVISANGVKDRDGNWYSWGVAKEFSDISDYEKVQYLNIF